MLNKNDFALEQLESRIEQFSCHFHTYLGICYRYVWGIPIPYLCWKVTFHCH